MNCFRNFLLLNFLVVYSSTLLADIPALPTSMMERLTEEVADLVIEPVYFDSGSSTLKQEDIDRFTLLAKGIQGLRVYVVVEAFTDTIGSPEANQTLSERRAQAVEQALLAGGLEANQVIAFGRGEARFEDTARQQRKVSLSLRRLKADPFIPSDFFVELKQRGVRFEAAEEVTGKSNETVLSSDSVQKPVDLLLPGLNIGLSLQAGPKSLGSIWSRSAGLKVSGRIYSIEGSNQQIWVELANYNATFGGDQGSASGRSLSAAVAWREISSANKLVGTVVGWAAGISNKEISESALYEDDMGAQPMLRGDIGWYGKVPGFGFGVLGLGSLGIDKNHPFVEFNLMIARFF